MTRRIELEAALATAETIRIKLETALAKGRAALASSVSAVATTAQQRDEANAKVLRARAYCRELQAALIALKHAEAEHEVVGPIDISGSYADELFKLEASAGAPAQRAGRVAVHLENERPNAAPGPQEAMAWPARKYASLKWSRRAQMLLRQTVGLTAVILAYLQYYYFDVQLEIAYLHPIVPFVAR